MKKLVNFLDGKSHASLAEIQELLDLTEGESYYLTQDLIYIGTLPGRWVGYDNGQWMYQVLSEQPLSKDNVVKPKSTKKTTASKSTKKSTTTKKSPTKKTTKSSTGKKK